MSDPTVVAARSGRSSTSSPAFSDPCDQGTGRIRGTLVEGPALGGGRARVPAVARGGRGVLVRVDGSIPEGGATDRAGGAGDGHPPRRAPERHPARHGPRRRRSASRLDRGAPVDARVGRQRRPVPTVRQRIRPGDGVAVRRVAADTGPRSGRRLRDLRLRGVLLILVPQKSRIALQVRMRFAAVMPQKAALKGHLVLARRTPSRHFARCIGLLGRESNPVARYKPSRARRRSRTSVSTSVPALTSKTTLRACQSKFLTWSARTTPVMRP